MLDLPSEEWSAYRARIRDEHAAGWLTPAHYLVLIAIADLICAGDDEPTVARIALYAGCTPRTVQRAKARGRERGLLAVRPQFPDGWQAADRYELVLPTEPVTPKPARKQGRQGVIPSSRKKESKRLMKVAALPSGGQNLLTARTAVIEARLLAQYQARRLL